MELITAIALGIGLAASTGFRVFAPMLVASIAAYFGVLPAQESFAWLGSWPAVICFGTATIIEMGTYYVPWLDNLLDIITTPLAVGSGTLLLTSVLPIDNDMLKWTTGFIIGGGISATVQTGTSVLRLGSSTTTAGMANPIIATGENVAAVCVPVLSLLIPLIVVPVLLLLVVILLLVFSKKIFRGKTSLKRRISKDPICGQYGGKLIGNESFCPVCGQPIQQNLTIEDSSIPKCPKCGFMIEPNSAFCSNCGKQVVRKGNNPTS
jgi:hypothetical protein